MWDASLVSLPMFTDGIATKWASHIHRGLTAYSEQSLFPHLFIIVLTYHALSPFSLQHEFIYHILLLLTLIYQSRCKGKKVHAISVATTRKLLLSSPQHQTHSYHKLQVRPSHLKGVLLLLLLKTIILLILLIVYILIIAEWLHVKLFITIWRDMRIR